MNSLLGQRSAFLDLLKDALVNQIKELRHNGKGRDVALAQSPQEFGSVQSLQINYARAFYQRQQQIGHLRQHVKHGQHAQQRIGRADVDPVKYRFHFAQKVGVGEHHALGVGGGARGVEQGSEIVRSSRAQAGSFPDQPRRSRADFLASVRRVEMVWPCGPGP